MPLLIFLKQPNRAIAVKGDEKSMSRKFFLGMGQDYAMQFEKLDGGAVLIIKDNVSHIEEISEEEIKKQKAEYEKKLKQERQRSGQLISPNLIFPRGGRN